MKPEKINTNVWGNDFGTMFCETQRRIENKINFNGCEIGCSGQLKSKGHSNLVTVTWLLSIGRFP